MSGPNWVDNSTPALSATNLLQLMYKDGSNATSANFPSGTQVNSKNIVLADGTNIAFTVAALQYDSSEATSNSETTNSLSNLKRIRYTIMTLLGAANWAAVMSNAKKAILQDGSNAAANVTFSGTALTVSSLTASSATINSKTPMANDASNAAGTVNFVNLNASGSTSLSALSATYITTSSSGTRLGPNGSSFTNMCHSGVGIGAVTILANSSTIYGPYTATGFISGGVTFAGMSCNTGGNLPNGVVVNIYHVTTDAVSYRVSNFTGSNVTLPSDTVLWSLQIQ